MTVRVMNESEFKSTKIGDRITFYKKPIESINSFEALTELRTYSVLDKYYKDPRGPILKTFTILNDANKPYILHHCFFLSKNQPLEEPPPNFKQF